MTKREGDSESRELEFDDKTETVAPQTAEQTVVTSSERTEISKSDMRSAERTIAAPMEFDLEPAGPTIAQPSPAFDFSPQPNAPALDEDTPAPQTQAEDERTDELSATQVREVARELGPPPPQDYPSDSGSKKHTETPDHTVKMTSPFDENGKEAPSNSEPTQRAEIPFDLRTEHSLPPSAHAPKPPPSPTPAGPQITLRKSPPSDPAPISVRGIPGPPQESNPIDIAAAIGVAPEPPPLELPRPASVSAQLCVPPPNPGRKIDLGFGAETSAPELPVRSAPREGLDSQQLEQLAEATNRLSRIIPIALAVLVLFASVAVTIMLFPSEERQEHIELRFLAIGGAGEITDRGDITTSISIETEPPGLLVLFDRQVLGTTPLLADIPVDISKRVAVELSSPYFDRYLGQTAPSPAGDIQLNVRLNRREGR